MSEIKYLLFDFETSDLYNKKLPPAHLNQAWPVQIGALYLDDSLNILKEINSFIAPPHPTATITKGAFDTHGITVETCLSKGISHEEICNILRPLLIGTARPVGHNVWFDLQFVRRYAIKLIESAMLEKARQQSICTMRSTMSFCKLPPTESMKKFKGLNYKAPKLGELYEILFDEKLVGAHDALADVKATHACLKELVRREIIILT